MEKGTDFEDNLKYPRYVRIQLTAHSRSEPDFLTFVKNRREALDEAPVQMS